MRVTILGCGSSGGVPLIGCGCAVCTSENPRDKRTRASIRVEAEGKTLLVDTSPDLRQQALRHGISRLDALVYTHAHADHLHGIDDIRAFNHAAQAPIPAYSNAVTLEEIRSRFPYVFRIPAKGAGWFWPCLEAHEIGQDPFTAAGLRVQPFEQKHGKYGSLGLRIGDFAYSTDLNGLPEASKRHLTGLKLWIVDCLQFKPAPTHAHLELALSWIAEMKPERAILTHMGHEIGYEALRAQLPSGIEPAYDGLSIEL